jgi:hypothetical protein
VEIPDLTTAQVEEGMRSLYRDPVAAAQRSIEYCLHFRGLHYAPVAALSRAALSRAARIAGLRFERAPGIAAVERSAVVYLEEREFELVVCEEKGGECCGGAAGLEPETMSGLQWPQEP